MFNDYDMSQLEDFVTDRLTEGQTDKRMSFNVSIFYEGLGTVMIEEQSQSTIYMYLDIFTCTWVDLIQVELDENIGCITQHEGF